MVKRSADTTDDGPRRSLRIKNKGAQRSSGSEESRFMSNVHNDILSEILVRLPDYRSALQCSTVCKSWRSLIATPEFTRSFKSHHDRRYVSFKQLFRWGMSTTTRSLPFRQLSFNESNAVTPRDLQPKSANCLDFLPHKCLVWACFDDLLLVSFNSSMYCVCNPFTKQWVVLPPAPPHIPGKSCGLVCKRDGDNITSFKVVLMSFENDYDELVVFCSETGKWMTTRTLPTPDPLMGCRRDVSVATSNGILHWLGNRLWMDEYKGILTFDPYRQRCRSIKLPSLVRGPLNTLEKVRIGVVRGRLRLLNMFSSSWNLRDDGYMLKVWELGEDGEEWFAVHEVTVAVGTRWEDWLMAIAFHPDDGNIVYFMHGGQDILRFEMAEGRFEIVGHISPPTQDDSVNMFLAKVFLQSLTLALPSSGVSRIPQFPPT